MKIEKISIIMLSLVALAWGTSYAIIKDTLEVVEPFTLMSIRFGGAAILLTLFYLNKVKNISLDKIKKGSIIRIFFWKYICSILFKRKFIFTNDFRLHNSLYRYSHSRNKMEFSKKIIKKQRIYPFVYK